ncbi:polysaccharide deacetylase family protein [Streptomyces sp. NPDC005438]|uniref:polysaccharide deacetylase family protein n=1 Tax=Streptomyces sp. NPDC005438 TaxID=3156880 RepID=UPI0033B12757
MRFVRQAYKRGDALCQPGDAHPPDSRQVAVRGAVAALLLALTATACGDPHPQRAPGEGDRADPGSSVESADPRPPDHAPPARSLTHYAERLLAEHRRRQVAAEHWKLARPPLTPPPPPAVKPRLHTPHGFRAAPGEDRVPKVITRVPTREKVVFITVDDGDHQSPALSRMLADLDVPISAFLTHDEVGGGYPYFRTLRRQGVAAHNHTLTHPYLPRLSTRQQRREICDQQDNLERELGERPRFFRPPFGAYDRRTLDVAASCGVEVVPLWSEEAFPDRLEYRDGDRLRPGDIILTHFRGPGDWNGTMPQAIRRILKEATDQGFAVARLEDYL